MAAATISSIAVQAAYRSLSNEWTYTSPSGESFVVASNVSENVSSEEEKPRGETETDSVLDVAVTASQIDTSTALSQNTLEHLFRPESDSDSSLSREHVVGAFQLLLSGAESNMGSADGAEGGGDGEPCDDAIAVATDVNLLSTGDLSDDYENVGSNGSEDSDSVDDDVVERREFPEEDVLLDEDAALMDDEFIQSLGGTLTLYAMDKNALRHFQWGDPSSKFETDTEEYRHLSNDVAIPIGELQDIADSPC
ncbi:hypothetical protein PC118_g21186 [Phytophthora cactorum]|uniref:Uncharacterized protein n=1 Tax=Phytophthora cactorum TaxID=29920 RepID=A0A8T1F5F1_9STRA|nr:hypothetical protein PC118_g21186 [Phytophthora cactorum]